MAQRMISNCTNFSKNILFCCGKVCMQNLPQRKVAKREISLIAVRPQKVGNCMHKLIVDEKIFGMVLDTRISDVENYYFI